MEDQASKLLKEHTMLTVVGMIEGHLEDVDRVLNGTYQNKPDETKSVRETTHIEGTLDEIQHRLETVDNQIIELRERLNHMVKRLV